MVGCWFGVVCGGLFAVVFLLDAGGWLVLFLFYFVLWVGLVCGLMFASLLVVLG